MDVSGFFPVGNRDGKRRNRTRDLDIASPEAFEERQKSALKDVVRIFVREVEETAIAQQRMNGMVQVGFGLFASLFNLLC
jgi:hypothetical protein